MLHNKERKKEGKEEIKEGMKEESRKKDIFSMKENGTKLSAAGGHGLCTCPFSYLLLYLCTHSFMDSSKIPCVMAVTQGEHSIHFLFLFLISYLISIK